jgi:N-acetylmuramoyl-L-alanine amidase
MTFPVGNVYVSKLKYGQTDSDSVKRLQTVLKIAESGNYDSVTDLAVIAWQKSIGDTPDPVGKSFLGPKQANLIFKGTGNNVIDDTNSIITTTTLGSFLKAQGHTVVDTDVPYGRDSAWTGVKYILVHHTASPDTGLEATIAHFVRTGGSYPPLSQIMLGQSGKVWMCSKQRTGQAEPGRANHAGKGSWPGVPTDRMNEFSLGIECQASGKYPLSDYPVMYKTLIKLIADLCRRYNLDETKVLGHKEWSTTGKIDPRDDMAKIRADVKAALTPVVVEPPKPPVVVEPPIVEPPKPPVVVPPTVPDGVEVGQVMLWDKFSGKPVKKQQITEAQGWVPVNVKVPATPISGKEDHMLYARVLFEGHWKPGTEMAKVECHYVRDGGTPGDVSDDDPTAYDERHYEHGTKSVPFQMVHWEQGQKNVGGQWYMKVHGGVSAMTLDTRYCKTAVVGVYHAS